MQRSRAAQLFHRDKDRVDFLKIFIYLTDVFSDKCGPHKYIIKSHLGIPRYYSDDRRYSDEEIEKNEDFTVKQFLGPQGTIFAVDTFGLHRGRAVQEGKRSMVQIQFSSSLFGANYNELSLDKLFNSAPWTQNLYSQNSRVFQRYV